MILRFNSVSHPRGAALVMVLLLCMILSVIAFWFVYTVSTSRFEARQYVYSDCARSTIDSAVQHAMLLLYHDLQDGPADSCKDVWACAPRNRPFRNRFEWLNDSSSLTNLSNQRWFDMPGPVPGTRARYRFKLVDTQPDQASPNGSQFLAPVAWHDGRWLPTDDCFAADVSAASALIGRFDTRATNAAWLSRAVSRFIDQRDENNCLQNVSLPDTEAVQFDRAVLQVDRRWNHCDDTLRLGRYYEERPNHNFFLVESAEAVLNHQTGVSNIIVTLDREPLLHVDGWVEYRKLREQSGLPRWYYGMWNGVIAATGSGLPEPAGLFTYQPVVSNTEFSLVFEDHKLERFLPKNNIRQTVTFDGWFSTLNEYMHARVPGAKEQGAFITTMPDAPDCIIITNLARNARYQVSLCTGRRLDRPLTMQAGFFGIDQFEQVRVQTNGIGLLRNGKPVNVRPLFKGDYVELVVRSPANGVSKQQPFYFESVLLDQPEFIVLRNVSSQPVNVKNWRLGYRFGSRLFWSAPFRRSSYYLYPRGRVAADESPRIPARSSLIITPDSSLFDWFAGANPDGVWGNSSDEYMPVIDVGWQSWGPRLPLKQARAVHSLSRKSSSNRDFTWETDWECELSDMRLDSTRDSLLNEIVFFDPDGDTPDSVAPAPGVIVAQSAKSLTVRLAGSAKRFSVSPLAFIQFRGIPASVRDLLLVTPDGAPAAIMRLPDSSKLSSTSCVQVRRDRSDRPVVEPFEWADVSDAVRSAAHVSDAVSPVINPSGNNPFAMRQILLASELSSADDWFICDSVTRPFSQVAITADQSLRWAPDTVPVSHYEGGWFLCPKPGLNIPEGSPGPLCREAFLPGCSPLSIKSFRSDSFSLCPSPELVSTQAPGLTAVIGPSPAGGGVHVFGSPGSFVCEWPNMPAPDKPVALTLSGRMAAPWHPPSSMNEWNRQTNDAPYLTIHLWNPHSKTFVPVVAKGRFDASDRLSLGTVDPVYFRNGFLRLKVTTHSVLQPDADALWLQNIFVHPYSAHKYVNVNTVQPYQLRNLNSADRSLARSLAAKSGPSFHFSSMRDVLDTIQSLFSPVAPSNLFLTVRSDLFDLCVEAEVYKQSDTAPVLLARSQRYIKLNRAPARLNPSHPIQKTF